MSLLSPERYVIGVAPATLSIRRLKGFAATQAEEKQVACDPAFGPQPWQGALEALKAEAIKSTATVVLSNHFVRYAIVPWSDALANEVEEQAYVRHHFAKIHGERAKAWTVRWSDNGAATRLAGAIDSELLAALKQALPRLASVQPYLMAVMNRSRGAIPKGGAWLALVEEGRACVALHSGRELRSIQNLRGDWLDLLERERHRIGESVPELALVAGVQPDPNVEGWHFRQLKGGLAH